MHLYCGFSLWRQMAPQQSAKFTTAFFGQFRTSLRKDSVANYASIWTLFSIFVRGAVGGPKNFGGRWSPFPSDGWGVWLMP